MGAISLSVYSSYIEVTLAFVTNGYKVRRSFTSSLDQAITILTVAGEVSFIDEGLTHSLDPSIAIIPESPVRHWPYTYWLTESDGVTIEDGPYTVKLTEHKVIHERKHSSPKVDGWRECPLCAWLYEKTVYRKGWTPSHQLGENWLPAAIDQTLWTITDEKYFDYGTYPQYGYEDGRRRPGVVLLNPGGTITYPAFPDTGSGVLKTWWYLPATPSGEDHEALVKRGMLATTTHTLGDKRGWQVRTQNFGWTPSTELIIENNSSKSNLMYGGGQIYTRDELAGFVSTDATNTGIKTVGGIMWLCPDCYSGMRRRRPWD